VDWFRQVNTLILCIGLISQKTRAGTKKSVLSIINGGGKWVELKIEADPIYQTILIAAEKAFWVKPPNPRRKCRWRSQSAGRQVPLQPLWRHDQLFPAHSVVELAVRCGARPTSSAQRRHMLQILPALLGAPFVAGLVLGGDQRVGATAPLGR
jgi:hypothetical protein